MMKKFRASIVWVAAASVLMLPAMLLSAERVTAEVDPSKAVDMFALMATKEIEVTLIPKDDTQSRVIIRNNTDQPLTVKLPDAFAGMPILAQRGGGIGGGRGGAAGGVGGAGQSVGGGMGGGMMGGGGMGMGMMNVAPEKVAQFKVPTVCLEHGKKVPHAHMAYAIHPIEKFSDEPELKALLTTFGKEGGNQRATQAAAWHLSNKMTWDQLANKRIEHLDGSSEAWFTPEEIQQGMAISHHAVAQAELVKRKKPATKKDSHSESTNRDAAAARPDEARRVDLTQ